MKKKIWLVVVAVLLTAAATLGAVFGVRALKANKVDTAGDVKFGGVMYLEDEYKEGDDLVFRIKAFSDKKYTAIKYSIDNGTEVATSVRTGESSDADRKNGKNYIDTGAEVISLAELKAATHVIAFYAYEGENKQKLGEYTFKIIA